MRLIKGIAFPLYFLFVIAWRRQNWATRTVYLTLIMFIATGGFITGLSLPSLAP